jgi:hypothetical protein
MSVGASEPRVSPLASREHSGFRHAAFWLDRAIGQLTEVLGAVIVVAETCILFAGVVSRYVFDSPIMWTDELGNFLFLWLSMLGTVVALRPLVRLGRRARGDRVRAADPDAGATLCR